MAVIEQYNIHSDPHTSAHCASTLLAHLITVAILKQAILKWRVWRRLFIRTVTLSNVFSSITKAKINDNTQIRALKNVGQVFAMEIKENGFCNPHRGYRCTVIAETTAYWGFPRFFEASSSSVFVDFPHYNMLQSPFFFREKVAPTEYRQKSAFWFRQSQHNAFSIQHAKQLDEIRNIRKWLYELNEISASSLSVLLWNSLILSKQTFQTDCQLRQPFRHWSARMVHSWVVSEVLPFFLKLLIHCTVFLETASHKFLT